MVRVWNETRKRDLGGRIGHADRWWPRLRGLIGRPPLEPGQGLLIDPCRGVHMYGMRIALDVAFVDGDGAVVALYPELRPGARTRHHSKARRAIELPAGTLAETGTALGDVLTWNPVSAGLEER
ncbi:MAG TPA: DUF192 domain-containing protein [Gemmatimonadota bacterium]|nr:DUF192 domain-containing protein [Gemmatimonadota bacterium]